MSTTITTTVKSMIRRNNTRNGNSRYVVETTDGLFHTEPDAADIAAIDPRYKGPCCINLNDKGLITGWMPLDD